MNDDEKADHDDALAHARWTEQNDADPHHTRIDGLGHAETNRYLAWHHARLRLIKRVIHDLTQPCWDNDLPMPDLPILHQQKTHHEQMIDRLKAALPPQPPKRARLLKPAPRSDTDLAAEVARYARTNGITVRQAADILNQRKATR